MLWRKAGRGQSMGSPWCLLLSPVWEERPHSWVYAPQIWRLIQLKTVKEQQTGAPLPPLYWPKRRTWPMKTGTLLLPPAWGKRQLWLLLAWKWHQRNPHHSVLLASLSVCFSFVLSSRSPWRLKSLSLYLEADCSSVKKCTSWGS